MSVPRACVKCRMHQSCRRRCRKNCVVVDFVFTLYRSHSCVVQNVLSSLICVPPCTSHTRVSYKMCCPDLCAPSPQPSSPRSPEEVSYTRSPEEVSYVLRQFCAPFFPRRRFMIPSPFRLITPSALPVFVPCKCMQYLC